MITENQLKRVIDTVLNEQNEETALNIIVQHFLNKRLKLNPPLKTDGLMGRNTEDAIRRYQHTLNRVEADGVWGGQTMSAMTPQDKQLWAAVKKANQGFFDNLLDKIF
jgi:peptidoglycan hydrolase-like protein with peptidoglycan-binding domain